MAKRQADKQWSTKHYTATQTPPPPPPQIKKQKQKTGVLSKGKQFLLQ